MPKELFRHHFDQSQINLGLKSTLLRNCDKVLEMFVYFTPLRLAFFLPLFCFCWDFFLFFCRFLLFLEGVGAF